MLDNDEQDGLVPVSDPAPTPLGPIPAAEPTGAFNTAGDRTPDDGVSEALVEAEPTPEHANDLISARVKRAFEQVPEIGARWRWYDLPYRLLMLAVFGKRVRRFWSKRVRLGANRLLNILSAFNHLERERISHLDDPLSSLQLPEDESIQLPVFWLVEYYSPSHVGELQHRLTRGKWRRDISRPGDLPHKLLRRGRDSRNPSGWEHLARFVPMQSESPSFEGTRAALPSEFASVDVRLIPIGSSLTAVVAEFRLSPAAQSLLDTALRENHDPQLYWSKGTLQVRQRMFVGIRRVQTARERLHDLGRSWMALELPGAFADRNKPQHPALDLLWTRAYDPVAPEHSRDYSNYLRALGLNNSPFRHTLLPEYEGVRLDDYWVEQVGRDRSDEGWQLVSRSDDGLSCGRGDTSTIAELAYVVPGLLTRLGLFALLDEKQTQAARARDAAHRLHAKRPVGSAKALRRSVLKGSLDVATIASDIEALGDSPYRYGWSLPDIEIHDTRVGHEDDKPDEKVAGKWAKRQRGWARELRRQDENLTYILGLSSSLSASIDSIRSQRWSLTVALLSLITSGVAAYLAYVAITVAQSSQ